MGQLSLTHILLFTIIVLVFFGPSRLPGLGKSLGEAIRGFKKGMEGVDEPPTAKQPEQPQPQHHQVASRHVSPLELSEGDSHSMNNQHSSKKDYQS
jgi:TatA/E family protein of Tat protein translocase